MPRGGSISENFDIGDPASPWQPVDDWTELAGLDVRIYDRDRFYDAGRVDAVTADGAILWLKQHGAASRRLVEKLHGRYVQISPQIERQKSRSDGEHVREPRASKPKQSFPHAPESVTGNSRSAPLPTT